MRLWSCVGIALVLAAWTFTPVVHSQQSRAYFDAPVVHLDPLAVPMTAVLDFDGDGDQDAIGFETDLGTNTSNRKLALYSNDGSGVFSIIWSTSFADSLNSVSNNVPAHLAVGSIGVGDGKDDFVFAYRGVIHVFRPTGASSTPTILTTISAEPYNAFGAICADFNQDGLGDFAILTASYLKIFRSNGASGFLQSTANGSFTSLFTMNTIDADGNGAMDIAVTGNGATTFYALSGTNLLSIGSYNHGIVMHMPTVGDIDGDSDVDMVIFDMSTYRVLRRTGVSSFTLEPLATGGPATNLADLDGDGDLDGCCCGGGSGPYPPVNSPNTFDSKFRVSLNQGGGVFAPAFEIQGVGARWLAGAVDLDNDGDRDLVAGRCTYFSRSGIRAPIQPTHSASPLSQGMLSDADRDGDPDVGFGFSNHFRNRGDGFLSTSGATLVTPPPTGTTFVGPGYPGDFDGDGDTDLVVEHFVGTAFLSMRLLLNNGGGALVDAGDATPAGIQFSLYTTNDARAALVRDYDGDGDLDLLMRPVPSMLYSSLDYPRWTHFWANNGTGQFLFTRSEDADSVLEVADMNGDSIPDLILSGNSLNVALGTGSGSFSTNRPVIDFNQTISLFTILNISPIAEAYDIASIVDLNADGQLDICYVSRSNSGAFLRVAINLTAPSAMTPNFTVNTPSSSLGSAFSAQAWAVVADSDADGLLEVIYGPSEVNAVGHSLIMEQTAPTSLTFAPAVQQPVDIRAFADLDGDGDSDALSLTRVFKNTAIHGSTAGERVQFAPGFAGSAGLPPIVGATGPFRTGLPASVHVRAGLGGAFALFVIGDSETSTPMLGALEYIHPVIYLPVQLGGTTNEPGAGFFDIDFGPLPPGLSGVSVFFQTAIADPNGPMGISRTNGLRVTIGG